MLPKTMSASSLKVATGCLARFAATHMDAGVDAETGEVLGRAQRTDTGTAALLGTCVHNSLEWFVKNVVMEGKDWRGSLELLLDVFDMFYTQGFGKIEKRSVEYKDGVKMLKDWHARTDFDTFEVVSCEVKTSFPVKINNLVLGEDDQPDRYEEHQIPFNYIWDRFDRIGPNQYRVVDYKTNRWGYSPDELRELIQARVYGLAAQIEYPDAEIIWVEFDMLRHEGPVGVSFTRADNIATWRYLKEQLAAIGVTPQGNAPETLNDECHYCIRKVKCGAIRANAAVGGIMSFDDVLEMADARTEMAFQKKALEAALAEIDNAIISIARNEDTTEFIPEVGEYNLRVGAQKRRFVDPHDVQRIIGPELWAIYGSSSIRMGDLDDLLSGGALDEDQKAQLERAISVAPGNPSVRSVKKRKR